MLVSVCVCVTMSVSCHLGDLLRGVGVIYIYMCRHGFFLIAFINKLDINTF